MNHDALRVLVQQKLADGRLSHDTLPKVWGGPGCGERCVACDETIARDQLVMEGINAAAQALAFHIRCFYLWDTLRQLPGRSAIVVRKPPQRLGGPGTSGAASDDVAV